MKSLAVSPTRIIALAYPWDMDDIDPSDLAKSLSEVPLFRELQRVIMAQTGPVNWEIARQVAKAVASAGKPGFPPTDEDRGWFTDACRIAELHITRTTSFETVTPLDDIRVMSRPEWAEINLEGFRGLIDRLASRLGGQIGGTAGVVGQPMMGAIGPLLFGLQIGFLVGYLSHRVLGQYDLCLPRHSPGAVYFVFPNIQKLEKELELEPQQFRLWLALHEVTHVLEFESIDWARDHFTGLVHRYIDAAQLDSSEVMGRLQGLSDPEELSRLMQHPEELMPMMMSPEQEQVLEEIQAFMSVLEGYSEWIMDQVGRQILPDFDKMREAVTRMRAEQSSAEKMFQSLLGIDLKREQYRAGEKFVRTIADAGKQEMLWEGTHNLPTVGEVADPVTWLERVAF